MIKVRRPVKGIALGMLNGSLVPTLAAILWAWTRATDVRGADVESQSTRLNSLISTNNFTLRKLMIVLGARCRQASPNRIPTHIPTPEPYENFRFPDMWLGRGLQ